MVIIFEELGIPYETDYMEFPNMKEEPFVSVNPNGRVPAIEDPNTGVSLFEVGGEPDHFRWEFVLLTNL